MNIEIKFCEADGLLEVTVDRSSVGFICIASDGEYFYSPYGQAYSVAQWYEIIKSVNKKVALMNITRRLKA